VESLRILIAEDHDAVRRAMRLLLEEKPHWEVCWEASTGWQAVEQVRRLKPDIALVDLGTVDPGGLDTARMIHEESPLTRIVLLTIEDIDAVADEARRAGAMDVVMKYDGEKLIAAIRNLSRIDEDMHIRGVAVGKSRHIGGFFRSGAERDEVLASFVSEGLKRGEKALHIIDSRDRQAHAGSLSRSGVHVDRAITHQQLDIVTWEEMYLREGRFDQDAMLARIEQVLQANVRSFPLTRAIGHMEWALQSVPGVEDVVQYEARLNDLLRQSDDVIVCAYDVSQFNGGVLMDILRAHPAMVIGGSLQRNPYFVPPEVLLDEMRHRPHEQRPSPHSRPGPS
jgi:DNA-binding NarL/FixJ family response regulator